MVQAGVPGSVEYMEPVKARGSGTASSSKTEPEPPAPEKKKSGGGMFGVMGLWRKTTAKLFDLEAKIVNQVCSWAGIYIRGL